MCVLLALSIKCWVCRSDADPKCADPFDNSTVPITDCKQEPDLPHLPGVRPTMCRKIRQKGNQTKKILQFFNKFKLCKLEIDYFWNSLKKTKQFIALHIVLFKTKNNGQHNWKQTHIICESK